MKRNKKTSPMGEALEKQSALDDQAHFLATTSARSTTRWL